MLRMAIAATVALLGQGMADTASARVCFIEEPPPPAAELAADGMIETMDEDWDSFFATRGEETGGD